jgi:hypothetical protein
MLMPCGNTAALAAHELEMDMRFRRAEANEAAIETLERELLPIMADDMLADPNGQELFELIDPDAPDVLNDLIQAVHKAMPMLRKINLDSDSFIPDPISTLVGEYDKLHTAIEWYIKDRGDARHIAEERTFG